MEARPGGDAYVIVPRVNATLGRYQHVRRAGAVAAGALVLATMLGGAVGATGAARETCIGAAARDPVHPCTNPSPTISPPKGSVALYPATFDCRPTRHHPQPLCAFGVPARRATATVALIGDSHAQHWRAAVEVVAEARRWRGFSITIAACPFSAAVQYLPVARRRSCMTWYATARRWFKDHPEVSTVFVSQKTDTPVRAPGRSELEIKRDGFLKAWSGLPKTVKRVVILRDVPDPVNDTFTCLDQAVATGTPPLALACPTPRAAALRPDPAVTTARGAHSTRYRVIDLSSLFCTPRDCYPVIGGVQVYADIAGHITQAYMKTVGPYLLRRMGG